MHTWRPEGPYTALQGRIRPLTPYKALKLKAFKGLISLYRGIGGCHSGRMETHIVGMLRKMGTIGLTVASLVPLDLMG